MLWHIRRLVSSCDTEPDGVLLERYLQQRDEAAFAELVQRHGAMVFGVCRRILHDEHQAEDALRATFLLLAQKGATVRHSALPAWLHCVARHLALKCRRNEERHRLREARSAHGKCPAPRRDPLNELTVRELLLGFDEELQRLPEVYRLPLILCALEGQSVEEAARRLGWAPGSVRGRLARGRARLHAQLARRGLTLPLGALTLLLAPDAGKAVLPPPLARAIALAARAPNATGASARAIALAEGGLKSIAGLRGKIGLALLLSAVAAVGVCGLAPLAMLVEPPAVTSQEKPDTGSGRAQQRSEWHGDPLPQGALARLGTTRFRLGGLVHSCAYSPDRKALAAGCVDGSVHVFDSMTGELIHRLRGHRQDVTSVAYSADGKLLASGSVDQTIILWEPAGRRKLHQFGGPKAPIWSLAFTADGKSLLSGGHDNIVYLWDLKTFKELRRYTGHAFGIHRVLLSPDGHTVAAAADKEIRLWEFDTARPTRRLTGPKQTIKSLAYSADGKLLASGDEDYLVWLWEASTGKLVHRFPQTSKEPKNSLAHVTALAFAPDGKTLAVGGANHLVDMLDVGTGKKLWEIPGMDTITYNGYHEGGIQSVAFSPDGKRLAFGQDNRLTLLDTQSGREVLPAQGHRGGVRRLYFGPHPDRLITVSDDPTQRVVEWDAASGRMIQQVSGKVMWATQTALSPDRKLFVSTWFGPPHLHVWDTATGKEIRQIPMPLDNSPGALTFCPDGKLLAVAAGRGEAAWLMDVVKGEKVCAIEGARGPQIGAADNRGGKQPAGQVIEWLSFSPDGRLLASVGRTTIHLAEVPSGRQLLRIAMPQDHYIEAAALSPDGRTLATPVTFKDRSVVLWETATGKERLVIAAPPGQLDAVAFAPDGRLLASAGTDRAILLWDTVTGSQVARWEGHRGDVTSLAFSPDGRRLASGSLDTTALIWDVPPRAAQKRPAAPLTLRAADGAWSSLAGADAVEAYRAIVMLEAHPEEALAMLAERLLPLATTNKRMSLLLAQLDSDGFAEREGATQELRKLSWMAAPALNKVLEGKPSPELRKRTRDLLAWIREQPLPAELLQMLRGMEVLERIGTPAARSILERYAHVVTQPLLTQEAKASLHRLSVRPFVAPGEVGDR
jgi:RNA polymerase sigma factor (sigma-70 family)